VADAAAVVAGLKAEGVVASAIGPDAVRLVTHFDVSREECERVAAMLPRLLG
jgi:threonine aldolase